MVPTLAAVEDLLVLLNLAAAAVTSTMADNAQELLDEAKRLKHYPKDAK